MNLEKALDRTSLRAGLIGKNLANVNTAGYKRLDTDFAIALEGQQGAVGDRVAAIRSRIGSGAPVQLHGSRVGRNSLDVGIQGAEAGSSDSPVTRDPSNVRVDGSSVNLETEIQSMTETQLRYEMLTELTSRYFGGLQSVIREGR